MCPIRKEEVQVELEKTWKGDIIAVSYTHLDVYKRQEYPSTLKKRREEPLLRR